MPLVNQHVSINVQVGCLWYSTLGYSHHGCVEVGAKACTQIILSMNIHSISCHELDF